MSWSGDSVGRGQDNTPGMYSRTKTPSASEPTPSMSLEFSHSAGDREKAGGLSKENSHGPGLSGAYDSAPILWLHLCHLATPNYKGGWEANDVPRKGRELSPTVTE